MKRIASIISGLALVTVIAAAPVSAKPDQAGLVNVAIGDITTGDILSDITIPVQAAVNLAANVCGVSVDVLATDFAPDGFAYCENAVNNRSVQLTQ